MFNMSIYLNAVQEFFMFNLFSNCHQPLKGVCDRDETLSQSGDMSSTTPFLVMIDFSQFFASAEQSQRWQS